MDDDVVDPTVFFEVGQHLLQLRPVRRPGGLTAVGELLDDQGAHRLGFTLIRFTLSGQGEALLRPAALGLLTGGDADVGDSPLRSELGLPGVSRTVVDCVGQAALLLLTKSCSASLGVRYPSAE